MTNNELESGILVEESASEKSEYVRAGLGMPAPAVGVQTPGYDVGIFAGASCHLETWQGRVEVDGHVEALARGEDGPEESIVVEPTVVMVVHKGSYKS